MIEARILDHVTVLPLLHGIAATLLASFIAAGWIALGSLFTGPIPDDDPIAIPSAILIGSGATAFVLALFTRAGVVAPAVIACGIVLSAALIVRRAKVASLVRSSLSIFGQSLSSAATRLFVSLTALVVWIVAISPPRGADAMRYHLAHIRQIAIDGGWSPIADFHYALPFGWTLNYLPFELLGIPQGAQVLGALLLVAIAASALSLLAKSGAGAGASLSALCVFMLPFAVRGFTDASADAYSLFVVFTVALFLLKLTDIGEREAVLFGFVSWIGIQSRYQLVAVGVAAMFIMLVNTRGAPRSYAVLKRIAFGALLALLLASPFYVANLIDFGNPVWPLLIRPQAGTATYADLVAYDYSRSLNGRYDLSELGHAVTRLATSGFVFPLPIITVIVTVLSARSRSASVKRLGWFIGLFLLLWVAVQPRLYPRFIALMLPVVAIATGVLLSGWESRKTGREKGIRLAATAVAMLLSFTAIAISWDNFRYIVSGNDSEYHRFTWFNDVYRWVNAHTERDARFLVIVSSGHSYYLDRPYRRADPWLSGVVDWRTVSNARALDEELRRNAYQYVLYEDRDWSPYLGGASMASAIKGGIETGSLSPVRSFDVELYTSRVRRISHHSRVVLLRRMP